MANPYYNPEDCGLTILGVLGEDGLSYEFNIFVVFQDETGRIMYQTDAGCSCPTEFENITAADLIPLQDFPSFLRALEQWASDVSEINSTVKSDVIRKVREAFGTEPS